MPDADAVISSAFARCLARADARTAPFRHWLLADVLPPDVAHALAGLVLPPPIDAETRGKRETHNQQRVFLAGARLAEPASAAFVRAFQAPDTVHRLQAATGAALGGTSLRVEYCQDTGGFWLEPHTDIGAKLFTMLIYLSEGPGASDWGTDIYDGPTAWAGRAPADFNRGLIFVPGADTWHGFRPRDIRGVRRSLIVNYVVPEWRARHELAYPETAVA
ncbi:MAG: 2OG-Fe(II) oxygenase [Alphaproteobacteria bacterium]